MRDFSWKYFTLTGDVESFMLYKEMDQYGSSVHPHALEGYEEELGLGEEPE
ncbi:YqzL family protein [Paenibacillus paeoniae]|uniref:YqzL family protein n=1 Tax=Paenibacillus paeoniae TaxID=2292705 RepID=A0A371PMG1_9BACL|nr:YqzL family protein [Paenibacillus paeoniae]REK77400.1 YqzL family protein [Paenibacillus paeoniae]